MTVRPSTIGVRVLSLVLLSSFVALILIPAGSAFAAPSIDPSERPAWSCAELILGETDHVLDTERLRESLATMHASSIADGRPEARDSAARLAAAEAAFAALSAQLGPTARLGAHLGFNGPAYHSYRRAWAAVTDARRQAARADLDRTADRAVAAAMVKVSLRSLGVHILRSALREPRPAWINHVGATLIDHHVATDGSAAQALIEVRPPHAEYAYQVFVTFDHARPMTFVIYDPAVVAGAPFAYDVFRPGSVGDLRTLRIEDHQSINRRARALGLGDLSDELLEAVNRTARRSFLLRRQIDQVLTFAAKLPSSESLSHGLHSYFAYWSRVEDGAAARLLPSSLLLNALTARPATRARVARAIAIELERAGAPDPARIFRHLRRDLRRAPPSKSRVDGRNAIEPWFIHYLRDGWSSGDEKAGVTNISLDDPNYAELVRINGGADFNDPAFARSEDPAPRYDFTEHLD